MTKKEMHGNPSKRRIRRLITAIAAAAASFVLLAGLILPCTLISAETVDKRDSSNYPADGSYRIKNLQSGLYLTAQIINTKKASTQNVILSALDVKDSGQSFVLKTEEDGSRALIPRNDGGKYSLCSGRPTDAPGELIKASARSDGSLFEIFFTDFGGYTIAPALDGNIYSVLTPSKAASDDSGQVTVDDYKVGDPSQIWLFEPMEASTGLSVAYKNTKLRLYSTGKFYSRYTPYFGTEPADACWESSDNSVILVGEDGSYSCIGTGTAEVTAFAGGFSASFTVTVVDSDCFTWYSQNNIISSDWNGEALTDLFMMSMGVKKRFAVNDDGHPLYPSWIDSGCALCSIAAVFHNMGAVMTNGYDLRSGQEGGLPADPYTVGMANTLNFEIYDKSKTYSGDPSYMYWQRCADAFTVDGEKIYYRSVYTQNRNMIKSLLKEHPQGVIAQLQNKVRTHYVVIGECINPNEKVSTSLEFKIYDPAAYNPSDGDGVLMKETTSGKYLSLGYYSIARIIIYDVESRYKK